MVGRPLDDAELVTRAQQGDAAAYEELVRRHQGIAFRTAYLIAGSTSDAEEAAHDAFVKAYRTLGRFRPSSSGHSGRAVVVTTGAARVVVPNVVGMRMDRATRTLKSRGLRVNEECSGFFGCIVKSRWWVCVQAPKAGRKVPKYSVVVIYAERRGEC